MALYEKFLAPKRRISAESCPDLSKFERKCVCPNPPSNTRYRELLLWDDIQDTITIGTHGDLIETYKPLLRTVTGEFNDVSLYKRKDDGIVYSVKRTPNLNKQKSKLAAEISILVQLGEHPHIIKMFALYENNHSIYSIMVKFSSSLEDRVYSTPGTIGEENCIQVCIELCDALSYMHFKGVCHGDLNMSNILCHNPFHLRPVVISDISSQYLQHKQEYQVKIRSFHTVAPEILVRRAQLKSLTSSLESSPEREGRPESESFSFLIKLDMWNMTMVIFELLTKFIPYSDRGCDYHEKIQATCKYCIELRLMQILFREHLWALQSMEVSQKGKDFMNAMLSPWPGFRPYASQALQLDWLQPEPIMALPKKIQLRGQPRIRRPPPPNPNPIVDIKPITLPDTQSESVKTRALNCKDEPMTVTPQEPELHLYNMIINQIKLPPKYDN